MTGNVEALRRLAVDAAAAVVRAAQHASSRAAGHAVAALEVRGYRAPDPAVEQLAAQLGAREAELAAAHRAATAAGRELTLARRDAAEQLTTLRAEADADIQRWVERAQQASERAGEVWEVLLEHGRSDLLRDRDVTTLEEAVRRALSDGPPVGEQITERIAEVVWQTGRHAPAAQHAFLSEPACREIACALAPLLADWLRAATADVTGTDVSSAVPATSSEA